ncbi:MAG: restriction endonuclease subunit S [Erysipelothrix sp.]|nr:restriction endonuclease subunit S [Erysipelothrix sp.]
MENKSIIDCIDLVGSKPDYFDGVKIYVSTGALDVNSIDFESTELINYDSRPSRANLVAQSGDLLFAKMAGTKKTFMLDSNTSQHIYSTGFFAIRAKDNIILPKCLFYILNGRDFLNKKDKNASGATQKALTNEGLKKIDIQVPDIDKQEKIVSALDRLTIIIENRRKQLEEYEHLIKSRFVEMFGDPIENQLDWITKSLFNVCESIVDCPHSTPKYTKEDTGFMCIRTNIIKKNSLLWDQIEYISKTEFEDRIKRRKPQKGDIVYSREGAILGIAAIIDREVNVALGQRCMLLSPNESICTSEFVCVAMNFESFLNKAMEGLGGSASPHINVGDIKNFKIILPPINLQKQFAEFVKQVDKLKFAIQTSLDKTQELFDSLMQEYFG